MLKLTEYQTCIIHLYTIKGKLPHPPPSPSPPSGSYT
jgi:hypothetical protein